MDQNIEEPVNGHPDGGAVQADEQGRGTTMNFGGAAGGNVHTRFELQNPQHPADEQGRGTTMNFGGAAGGNVHTRFELQNPQHPADEQGRGTTMNFGGAAGGNVHTRFELQNPQHPADEQGRGSRHAGQRMVVGGSAGYIVINMFGNMQAPDNGDAAGL